MDYLVIADNEVRATTDSHEHAQVIACSWSNGRYDTAKVIYLPNMTMQGHWYKGQRIQ